MHNRNTIYTTLKQVLPWLLPILLLFFRALADITVLLIGLAFLIRSHQQRDWTWLNQTWFKLSLLFWLYLLLINTPLSINPADSLLHALFYIRWPLFAAALAYGLLNNITFQHRFLIALLCTCTFILFDTGLQYFSGVDLFGHTKHSPTRLTGPYSRPIPGIMLLRVWFIVLLMAVLLPQFSSVLRRISFTLAMLSIGLLFIFITGERMALILYMAGSVVVVLGLLSTGQHRRKVILGVLTMLTLFVTAVLLNPETAERSVYSTTDKLRYFFSSDYGLVFRAAIVAWREQPILGSGFHTYKSVCESLGVLPKWDVECTHPHNLYLQIAAETGLIGLILFSLSIISIYYTALVQHIKAKRWLVVSLSFAILSVCFWPLIGGISILNNGVAALVWLGVGWTLTKLQTTTHS